MNKHTAEPGPLAKLLIALCLAVIAVVFSASILGAIGVFDAPPAQQASR